MSVTRPIFTIFMPLITMHLLNAMLLDTARHGRALHFLLELINILNILDNSMLFHFFDEVLLRA